MTSRRFDQVALFSMINWPCFRLSKCKQDGPSGPLFGDQMALFSFDKNSAFDATMFNWSCYMNLSYRENPPDPHIHWWVVPRYSHSVKVGTLTFEDPLFGSPYDHAMRREVSQEVRQLIAERLRQGTAA